MRDITNGLHLQPAFVPIAAVTDGTAQVSLVCDTLGYNAAMLAIVTGTLTDVDATWTMLIEESSDNSTFTTVAASDLDGTMALAGFTFADDNKCKKIGYCGSKRYIRATITNVVANTGNLFVAGVWVLGKPNLLPTSNPPA